MDKIIFQSLYNDHDLSSLKHAILYFNEVVIPSNSYPVKFGEGDDAHINYLRFVPENVYDQIEYLGKQKIVTIKKFGGDNGGDSELYWNAIVDGLNALGRDREFPPEEIEKISQFLEVKNNHPNKYTIVSEASVFIASVCLMEFSLNESICCVDNPIIYDNMNFGMRQLLENIDCFKSRYLEEKKIKANILARKLLSVNLPSFEFETFDDVLELREKHKDGLLMLNNYLFDISDKIEIPVYEEGFDAAVDRLIAPRIQPAIESFRREVTFSASNVVKRIYVPAKSLSFSAMLSTATPEHIKLILAGGFTLASIEGVYELISRRKFKNSPFAVFMDIK